MSLKPGKIVTTKIAGPASYTKTSGGTITFSEFKNVRRVINIVHDHASAPAYRAIVKSNSGAGNTRTVFIYGLDGAEVNTGNYSTSDFVCTLELAEGDTLSVPKPGKIVSTRIAGPAAYTTGGDVWTFSEFKNVRRVVNIIHDDVDTPAYEAYAIAGDGVGNTRTVRVYDLAGTQVGLNVDLHLEYFIVTLELAE